MKDVKAININFDQLPPHKSPPKLQEWWEDSWLYDVLKKLRTRYYELRRGLRNLYIYFPIIWKDRDWDSFYTLDLLIFKLKKQRDYLVKNDLIADIQQVKEEMDECIALLEKVNDEWGNYEEPALDLHNAKWGKTSMEFFSIPDTELSEVKIKRDKVLTDAEKEVERAEYRESMERAASQRTADFQRALQIFIERSDTWWD